MPIYEYQGKHYDLAIDDPAAAKAKILDYLGTQGASKPAPVAPVAPRPAQLGLSNEFDFSPPMGVDAEPAPVVGKEPEPPKRAPYKNRLEMLDDAVNLLEEGADQEKLKQSLQNAGVKFEDVVKHGQKRNSPYFKQQAPMATPAPPRVKAEPAAKLKPHLKLNLLKLP
jgi:hypothetical protein